jgi:hypothetical protein
VSENKKENASSHSLGLKESKKEVQRNHDYFEKQCKTLSLHLLGII